MRQSQLFTKTKKQAPKGEQSRNAQLLERAGFIQKAMAGVYSFLPLGVRVIDRIENIIREEMEALGGQEVFLTALQDPEPWKKSGRWDDEVVDVWFRTKLKNGTLLGLSHTHEEPIAKLMQAHVSSYKDLPIYAYQFQTKFRNELRARSGLMRVREFVMKDLYSFNRTQEGLDEFYEKVIEAYNKIFDRVGIGDITYVTFASGEPFSKFSHEFQTISEAGDDTIYVDKKKRIAVNKEVLNDDVLKEVGLKKSDLAEERAIEVGNIFKLGTKYAEAEGLMYVDEKGKKRPVVMGSYGIGPGRLMGTIVEVRNDDQGIIWPFSVAPFSVHLIELSEGKGKGIYESLLKEGIEVLYDDREASAGEKFADCDLIGIPYRVVISEKTGDKAEIRKRDEQDTKLVSVKELIKFIKRQK